MQGHWEFRRTTIIIFGLGAFLAGLASAKFSAELGVSWIILSLIFVLVSLKISRTALLFGVILLGFTAGMARGSVFTQKLKDYETFYDQPVILTGTAELDGVYTENSQLSFDISDVYVMEPEPRQLIGKVKVEGFGTPAVYRGDVVEVEGKLRSTLGSRQARIGFAQIQVLGRSGSVIEKTRHSFVAGMFSALPEPLASFGLGLLVGQRNTLPDKTREILSMVGLTHIIAVSGYNLTILVRGTRRLFNGRSKYQSLVASLVLIGTFLLFTGFSASIVRASVVSCLGLVAWYWGRKFRPMLLLLLAATLTAGWYPLYIWSDIGWHLSFLAFFGVLVLAPMLVKRFYKKGQPRNLSLIVIESICAQAMTLPLIIYIFHEFSLISLLANILVVPLVPLAMFTALVAGVAGMLVPALSGWAALPARLLMTYMLDVATLLSQIPGMFITKALKLYQMLVLYGALILTALILWREQRHLTREA